MGAGRKFPIIKKFRCRMINLHTAGMGDCRLPPLGMRDLFRGSWRQAVAHCCCLTVKEAIIAVEPRPLVGGHDWGAWRCGSRARAPGEGRQSGCRLADLRLPGRGGEASGTPCSGRVTHPLSTQPPVPPASAGGTGGTGRNGEERENGGGAVRVAPLASRGRLNAQGRRSGTGWAAQSSDAAGVVCHAHPAPPVWLRRATAHANPSAQGR